MSLLRIIEALREKYVGRALNTQLCYQIESEINCRLAELDIPARVEVLMKDDHVEIMPTDSHSKMILESVEAEERIQEYIIDKGW